jgi:hypothetical protein
MGRRQKRKRERQQQQRSPDAFAWSTGPPLISPSPSKLYEPDEEEYDYLFQSFGRNALPGVKACGGCKEFIEDAEGGRGTCLHPGSGILSPWTDTPGCDFHTRRR